MLIEPARTKTLTNFLQEELAVSSAGIALAQRRCEDQHLLPMVLWQYGLLTLEQLEQVFDWFEALYSLTG